MILIGRRRPPVKLFVGLDVSSFDMKVCFLNGDGEQIETFTVSNDLLGAQSCRRFNRCLLGTSIEVIRTLQKQIKEIDKAIERIMAGLTQTLQSIPGIGPVFAAGIIAEISQIERFEDETRIAKYAGLYWRKHQSGHFTADDTSLSRKGNQYLRYYLVEAANSVRRHIPEYQEYYVKKFNEVPKHQHKRALVLTARRFMRLVDALLRNHQLYTPKGA